MLTWAQIAIGILYSGIAHERQPNFRHRKKIKKKIKKKQKRGHFKRGRKSVSYIFASALFLEPIQISLENSKGKEFDGFQIILKLEICAEKIVFNCSTLKKNRLLFVTFKSRDDAKELKLKPYH